jgi:hypothetical protein
LPGAGGAATSLLQSHKILFVRRAGQSNSPAVRGETYCQVTRAISSP